MRGGLRRLLQVICPTDHQPRSSCRSCLGVGPICGSVTNRAWQYAYPPRGLAAKRHKPALILGQPDVDGLIGYGARCTWRTRWRSMTLWSIRFGAIRVAEPRWDPGWRRGRQGTCRRRCRSARRHRS